MREAAAVRVLVAIGAEVKGNANILRLAVRAVGVALGALHLCVQTGQRISGLAVIELGGINLLPVHEVMARLAVWTQPPLVEILVARNAGRRQAEISAVQVLVLDRGPFLRRNMRSVVALIAFQAGVLALKKVSRVFMVEGLRVELDQREIFAVVFGMALGAFLAGALRDVVSRVKSAMGGQAAGDFGVAFQALEGGLSAELVTTRAIGGSVQRLVRSRERARRDLGLTAAAKQE